MSAPHTLLGGDGVEISAESLFGVGFEFLKHDSVPELGVAGDDRSANDRGVTVEPESRSYPDADRQRNEDLDVTPAAAQVGGFQPHRDVVAFLANFDLNLDGITRILSPVRARWKRSRWLLLWDMHGDSGRARAVVGARPRMNYRQLGTKRLGRASRRSVWRAGLGTRK